LINYGLIFHITGLYDAWIKAGITAGYACRVAIIPRFRGICHYFDPLPLFKLLPLFATIHINCHFLIFFATFMPLIMILKNATFLPLF
jgi:hypothetical protein